MNGELHHQFDAREQNTAPTIEQLRLFEKGFPECFGEATIPILLWLNDMRNTENTSYGSLKDYLQSQHLPILPELRSTKREDWGRITREKNNHIRKATDRAVSKAQQEELSRAIQNRRIMQGKLEPKTSEEKMLPKFSITESRARNFMGMSKRTRSKYRINIPDAPEELREVILDGLVKQFWQYDSFRTYGFTAKIIGLVKTDGLILYLSDQTINDALRVVSADATAHNYGNGEPARFAQKINERIPGITITSNPEGRTFGDVISELLAKALKKEVQDGNNETKKIDDTISQILDLQHLEWIDKLGDTFTNIASEEFGSKLNTHNLSFIDQG